MEQALAEFTYSEFISLYENDRRQNADAEMLRHSTLKKLVGQMKAAAEFLPAERPLRDLTSDHFRDARSQMLKQYKRRTARNYLSAALELLRWAYAHHSGGGAVSEGIREAVKVKRATNRRVKFYDINALKKLFAATAGTSSQLDLMLALNCGMYQADIGRLELGELDLAEGSVFWDREKEPGNEFRIHHMLWPETVTLAKRYLNDGSGGRPFLDYLDHTPVTKNTADLAFLDKGRPRYRVTASGHAYDLVGRRWAVRAKGYQLRNVRKSANDLFCDLIQNDGSLEEIRGVDELSHHFLGQTTDDMLCLYRSAKKKMHTRMNRYLAKLGDYLRANGVFEAVK